MFSKKSDPCTCSKTILSLHTDSNTSSLSYDHDKIHCQTLNHYQLKICYRYTFFFFTEFTTVNHNSLNTLNLLMWFVTKVHVPVFNTPIKSQRLTLHQSSIPITCSSFYSCLCCCQLVPLPVRSR